MKIDRNERMKDKIRAHYEQAKEAICKSTELDSTHTALIHGHTGWYAHETEDGIEYKKLQKFSPDTYDTNIEKIVDAPALYTTLNYFDDTVFTIRAKKDDDSPGGYGDTQFYRLSIDIDLKSKEKVEGLTRDRDVEEPTDLKILEDATQYAIDWLIKHCIPIEIIKPYFSGNGTYVTIAPEVAYFDGDAQKASGSCTAFNAVIGQMYAELRLKYPKMKNYVQYDALNNSKRQWKTILSLHKKKPFACIPLDPSAIKINLESARIPLKQNIFDEAMSWSDRMPTTQRDDFSKTLETLFASNIIDKSGYVALIDDTTPSLSADDKSMLMEEKISPALIARMSEIRDVDVQHVPTVQRKIQLNIQTDLNALPPCIRCLLGTPQKVAHARTKALLAAFLGGLDTDKYAAKETYDKICSEAGGATSNIFPTWYGVLTPPSCSKIKTSGGGYPRMEMGDLNICDPDSGCAHIRNPLQYAARKKASITVKDGKLNLPLIHDGVSLGELVIFKSKGSWKHILIYAGSEYEKMASSPLGLKVSPASEKRMRGWIQKIAAASLSEDTFGRDVWDVLKDNLEMSGVEEQAQRMPSDEARKLVEIIKTIVMRRQIDPESNYPISLSVQMNGQKGTLNMDSKTLLQVPSLQVAFMKEFGFVPIFLDDMSKRSVLEAIAVLHGDGKVTKSEEIDSTAQYIQQAILVELQRSRPTRDINEAATMGRVALLEDGKLWLPNTRIQALMKAERIGTSLRKVREWMNPFMAGDAAKKRVGSETIRFWPFDPAKCEVSKETIQQKLGGDN